MRKLTTILLIALSLFQVVPAIAQSKFYIRDMFDLYNDIGSPDASKSNIRTYNQIKGSPYINEEFVNGTIINDSASYQGILLRYNAYEDRMEFKPKSGVELYFDTPEKYKQFIIADKKYVYCNELHEYFELLQEGKISLLKKESIFLNESEPAQPFKDPKPAEFRTKPPVYYISINNGDFVKIKKDKDLLDIISSNKKEVQTYISKNKLKVKNEEDLQKIISYYNQLL